MNNLISFIYNIQIDDIISFLIAFLIILIFLILSNFFTRIILRLFKIKATRNKNISELSIYKPISIFFKIIGVYLAILYLQIPLNLLTKVNTIFHICVILLTANTLSSLLNEDSSFLKKIQTKLKVAKGDSAISLLTKIGKILIYAISFVLILYRLGYNLNGLLAGLGVFSVIITFAAQDTAQNLFGGFVILFDKPFIVGDWVQLGQVEGIVEDLSLRSTRIRTFSDSLITIPNATVSNESIINWSKMKVRKITIDLIFELSTPLTKVNSAIDKLYLMLQNHPDVLNDNIQVHFEKVINNGYSIRVAYFINNTTYIDYLNIRENVNYKLISTIEQEKVKLAYPSQSIYLKK